jgi:MFS family permease
MRKESKKILRLTQLIVLIDYAAVGAMRTVLPYYAKRLGASGTKVGGLETVYGIGQVSGSLALGWLLDARGRKVVLLLSFLGAALGYGLASVAVMQGSVTLLLLSRLPVGLAKQTVTATRAVVSDVTSPAERSESLARLFAGCSLGYAIGPYLGGLLADGMGDASPAPALICAGIFVLLLPTVAWLLPETSQPGASSSTAADGPALAAAQTASGSAADSAAASSPKATPWLLLVGVTLPEAALIMLSSTALPLLSQRIGWSATQLGEFSSAWGISSGTLSLTLWPFLLKADAATGARRGLSDRAALRMGVGALALACGAISLWPTALSLWCTLPLATVAVGMIRTIPASLLTTAAPASHRGVVLGQLDAASSLCRVLLPTSCGAISDRFGLWAAFAVQAGLCVCGLVLIETWAMRESMARPREKAE